MTYGENCEKKSLLADLTRERPTGRTFCNKNDLPGEITRERRTGSSHSQHEDDLHGDNNIR